MILRGQYIRTIGECRLFKQSFFIMVKVNKICRSLLVCALFSVLRRDVVVLCLVDTPERIALFLSHLHID